MSTRKNRSNNKNNKNKTYKKKIKNFIKETKTNIKNIYWKGLENYKEYLTIDKKFWEGLTIEKIDEDSKHNDKYVKKLLKSYYKPLVKSITKWRYTEKEKDELKKHNDILFHAIIDKKKEILRKRQEKKQNSTLSKLSDNLKNTKTNLSSNKSKERIQEDTKEKNKIKNKLIIETKMKSYRKNLLKKLTEIDIFLKTDKTYGTMLHKAIEYGSDINVIKHICNKSNKAIELKKKNGNTPLHIAAYLDKVDIVLYLISKFEKAAGITNKQGKVPLDLAEEKKHKKIIQILKRNNLTEEQKKIVKKERKKEFKNIIIVLKTYKEDLKTIFKELGENNKYKDLYTLKDDIITLKLEDGNELQLEDLMNLLEKKIDNEEEEEDTPEFKKERKKLEKKYGKDTPEFKKELKKLKKKTKQSFLYKKELSQHKTNHAVTALKRFMQSSKKLGKSSYLGAPPPIERPAKLTEKDLLNIKKREEAEELLTVIGGIYGYESAEYKEVISYVLTPTSDKRTELNSLLFKISEIKPEGSKKRKRVEKLLKKYDDFLKTLLDPDEYNKVLEEMSQRASMKLLGKTKIQIEPEEITPSTGFFKKFWSFLDNTSHDNKAMYLLPILINLSEITGVTMMKLMTFFTNYGINILKYIKYPRRIKTIKRNKYFYKFKRNATDRFNSTLKNDNLKKNIYDYRRGFSDAKKVLKNLYKEGYRDALIKMKKKKKGGYNTRKNKNKKQKNKRKRRRFTFRKKN